MAKRSFSPVVLILMLACGLCALAAPSPLPVYVKFHFNQGEIVEDGDPEVEEEVTKVLISALQAQYDSWEFKLAQDGSLPLIVFSVKKANLWDLHMQLHPEQGEDASEWQAVLYDTSDLLQVDDEYPSSAEAWAERIRWVFENRLLKNDGTRIRRVLRDKVRIGDQLIFKPEMPSPEPVVAVLLLPRDLFIDHVEKDFLIKFQHPNEVVRLHSIGTGVYEGPPEEGIRVIVNEWKSPSTNNNWVGIRTKLQHLPELGLIHFYFFLPESVDRSTSVAQ